MTRKIDMEKLCPELALAIAEIERVEKYFTPGVKPKAIQNTEVRFTFAEAKAIAATMLKLAEEREMLKMDYQHECCMRLVGKKEKQEAYNKGYDDGVTGQPRKGRAIPTMKDHTP